MAVLESFLFSHLCVKIIVLYCFCSKSEAISPNIVFILADDLGWDDVGFHGSEIKTPNIDRLAKEGVILNNYYVQPICTPTRGAILTGRYPIHTGLQHYVIVGSQPYGLPLEERTMAQHFKSRGYKTHAIGKWHLGFFKEEYLPTHRGFDSHIGYYLGKEDYFDHYGHDGGFWGYDYHRNGQVLLNQSEAYSTELFTTEAESIIRAHNQSEPLFLYLAHQAVHSGNKMDPIQVPQKYIDRFPYIKNYKRRMFAGAVSALDDSVGRLFKALKDTGLAKNTVLAFSTDNGGPTNGFDHNAASNWPLRGCKKTIWQGGVRGVGFVHSPLLKKSGYVSDILMHAVDWLPTLLHASDATNTTRTTSDEQMAWSHESTTFSTDEKRLDGINQWHTLSHKGVTSRQELLINIDPITGVEGVVVGDFKLVKGDISHGKYDGWYPPLSKKESLSISKQSIDYYQDFMLDFDLNKYRKQSNLQYKSELHHSKHMTEEYLENLVGWMNEQFDNLKKTAHRSAENYESQIGNEMDTVTVKCGPKPSNASTNCQPKKHPCLFHLISDPCEYNNLAELLPGIVIKLLGRLDYYRENMVAPGNKPIDPKGNPQLHGGVWKPWL